jgi:Mlc titration factor MtfA (ptsG expression regulator)
MFGLLRRWRRSRLRQRPFPADWMTHVDRHLGFYQRLPEPQRARFLDKLKVFAWEKYFLGAGGLEMTDEIRVTVSGAAARLILNLPDHAYDRLTEIVVYPGAYHHPEDQKIILGEAHNFGTVVLSWKAVVRGLANPCDGHDTAAHEFAHVLDRASGAFNGTPILRATEDYRVWGRVMTAAFDDLRGERAEAVQVLRRYGATNEAEFFAVATESFFEKTREMREHTPELYNALRRFYGYAPSEDPRCARAADR